MVNTEGEQLQRVDPSSFGRLLLRYRRAAGLTQEDLADAAGMSVRTISNLERGHARAAQPRSAESLCGALGLAGERRREFLAAARTSRRHAAGGPAPAGMVPTLLGSLGAPLTMVPDFTGRDRELERIRIWYEQARDAPGGLAVAIVGPPGVGKTTLATAVAYRMAAEFPDGCVSIDLQGTDAQATLDCMLQSLGVSPGEIPPTIAGRSSLLRLLLAGRRILLVLDNVTDEAQVRQALTRSQHCLTVMTSRQTLSGLEATRWLRLAPLSAEDAVGLLAAIIDPARVQTEPEAARELVDLCGNLPLALRIAGNRMALQEHWAIASFAAQLRDAQTRLTALSAGDLQVRSAFEVSYRRLPATARHMFRRLALVPGADFGIELAAIAAGTEPAAARRPLDDVVDATLVQPSAKPGRYQFHDLIRIFSKERLEAEENPDGYGSAADSLSQYLLRAATDAGRLFAPGINAAAGAELESAADWLETESSNWIAAARQAAVQGRHEETIMLARAMRWYSSAHQRHPWADVFTWGADAARATGNRQALAELLNCTGWTLNYGWNPDLDARLTAHREALAIAVEIGDRHEEAWALCYLGAVLARLGDDLREALEYVERATAIFTELGYWPALSSTRNVQGRVLRRCGRYAEALAAHQAVLAELDRREDQLVPDLVRYQRAHTQSLIGEVLLHLKDWRQAARIFRDARSAVNPGEIPVLVGRSAFHEAISHWQVGDLAAADECLRFALRALTGTTVPSAQRNAMAGLAEVVMIADPPDEVRRYLRDILHEGMLYEGMAGSNDPR